MAAQKPPLPDYDHLNLASLQHRIRPLTAEQLRRLVAFEEAHGNRLPVLEMMRRRLEELEAGAEPSAGDPLGERPEAAPPANDDAWTPADTVSRAPSTDPAPHGVPAQPAKPKGDRGSPGRSV